MPGGLGQLTWIGQWPPERCSETLELRQSVLILLFFRVSLILKETFLEVYKGREFHTGFFGQRGKQNSISLLREAITVSRNKA